MTAGKRILFFAPFGGFKVHHQFDAVVASALRLRGCEPFVVLCDGIYAHCDVLVQSGPKAAQDCAGCAGKGKTFFGSFDLPTLQLRAFIEPNDFPSAERWADQVPPADYAEARHEDLEIGRWATSSVFSYFRISVDGLTRPDVRKVHRQFLINSLVTYRALSRIVEKVKPGHFCVFNARMAPYRVAFEFAKKAGIPVVTHERGGVDDSFSVYDDENCLSSRPMFRCADLWKPVPLTREECSHTADYLASRETGKGINYPSFYSYNTELTRVRRSLRIPESARILLVVTSSEFEQAYSEHYQSNASQMEVLDRLIELFKGREEYLVIRHHPYIAGMHRSPPDYSFLSRAYRQAETAPPNVRIVMPSERMSSYALFWNVDACVAFFSTAGIEAAARGIATASFPKAHYHQVMTRTISDTTLEALDQLVSELFQRTHTWKADDLRPIYRFLHAFIAKLPRRFKSFGIDKHFLPQIRFKDSSDLLPGMDLELDRICDHIQRGAPLVPVPTQEELGRDASEESQFLHDQWEESRRKRSEVRRQGERFTHWRLTPPVAVLRMRFTDLPPSAGTRLRPRHTEVVERLCAPTRSADDRETLRAVLAALEGVRAPYVLVTYDSILHDESFLSSASDELLDDSALKLRGLFFGGWIAPVGGLIDRQIFTQQAPAEKYEEALAILPAIRQPHALLPFCLFRSEALKLSLEKALSDSGGKAAARILFAALHQPDFRKTLLPMLLITDARGSEVH